MKPARLNHIGDATRAIGDSLLVIASEAKQSSGCGRQSGLPRFARNDEMWRRLMKKYAVRMNYTVPMGTKAKLKERARVQGISMSKLLRRITGNDDESKTE